MISPVRRAAAAATACALGLGTALAVALPASADSHDFVSDGVAWWDVVDDAVQIIDANPFMYDLFGSGIDVDGWTYDAFDTFLDGFHVSAGVIDYDMVMTPVSVDINPGGVSTFVATGEQNLGGGFEIEAQVTLTLAGSYARWEIDTAGTDGLDVWVTGQLGSGPDTVFPHVTPTTLVSASTSTDAPIIGYQLSGAGAAFDVADGSGEVHVDLPLVGSATLVMAFQDYDPCSRDAALAAMVARVGSLGSTFGQTITMLDSNCFTVDAPSAFPAGTSTDQTLALLANPALFDQTELELFLEENDEVHIQLLTQGLPAGMSLEIDPATATLHLTGTAAAGSYPVRFAFFRVDSDDDAYLPLLSTITLQVVGDDEAADPELAATGASDAAPAAAMFGGMLLLVGAVLGGLRSASRRRARA